MIDIEVVSFDADGTIVESNYVHSFWFQALPKLYSEKKGVEFEEAKEILTGLYDELGDEDIRWYQPEYWFERFDLDRGPGDVIESIQVPENVKLYDDAVEVINQLNGHYRLIVTSNSPRIFLDYALKGIEKDFHKVYSCVSDFGEVKKDETVYRRVTGQLGVKGEAMVHIGDHWKFDYEVPRKIGINTFYIDRKEEMGQDSDKGILRDMRKVIKKIKE